MGCCPFDSFKITGLLVNPATQFWWEFGQLLVKSWGGGQHWLLGTKNPAVTDGVVCVRFCREMDSDNNAPCFSLEGFVSLSALETGHQASRRNLSGISNPLACDTSDRSPDSNGYCDGEHWQHGVLLSEDTISFPA